jgi:thiamine-monophosphate kinase
VRGEDRLTAWLRRRLGPESLIGDDAAALPAASLMARGGAVVAATVDQQIEGVHFPPGLDPAVVARRLLAVNLSDLAAVGAEPAYALLVLAAAPGFDHRRFLGALAAACARHGTVLAGGDLAALPAPGASGGPGLTAGLTLIGRLPPGGAWLARGAARPGDALWVGGTLGESAAGRHLLARGARLAGRRVELPAALGLAGGLAAAARRAIRRHLAPAPQLALGHALGRLATANPGHPPAAIDVSDGLARDLGRLCRESNAGAEVDLPALPLAPRAGALAARLGLDPLDLALGGGEDYVLLFTLPEGAEPPLPGATRIGRVTAGRGLTATGHGPPRPLAESGWDHLEKANEDRRRRISRGGR